MKYNLIENGTVKRIFHDLEECVVLYLDGKSLGIQREIICFLYISPAGSTVYNGETGYNGVEVFESKLCEIVQKYTEAYIILAGDFNARCGDTQDMLLNDDVDFVFQEEAIYESDFFELPRRSKDQSQNNFGLSLIKLCKTYGIHILNGRSPGDSEGEITCIANDGSSIVDYFIASRSLFQSVSSFKVENRSESVHFPLRCCLTFNLKGQVNANGENDSFCSEFKKFKRRENLKDRFMSKFTSLYEVIQESILNKLNISIDDCVQFGGR